MSIGERVRPNNSVCDGESVQKGAVQNKCNSNGIVCERMTNDLSKGTEGKASNLKK